MVMLRLFILTSSGQWSTGQPVPFGSLAEDEDLTSPQIVADKADLFLAMQQYLDKGKTSSHYG